MKSWPLKVLLIISGLLILYAGFVQYEKFTLNQLLSPHLKTAAIRLTNQARFDIETAPNLSYSEYFSRVEIDLLDIDKRILDIQVAFSSRNNVSFNLAITQMKNVQEVLRALSLKMKRKLILETAIDNHRRALSMLVDAIESPFFENASKSTDHTIEEVKKAEMEYEYAFFIIRQTLEKLQESNSALMKKFPADTLVDPNLIKSLAAANLESKIKITYGK